MKIRRLAAIAGTAATAVTALGATAASASTGPGAQSGSGNAPATAASSGRTYVNEHGPDGNSDVVYQPGIFRLLSTRPASIFSRPTEWQNSSVAFGPMWGERYGVDRILVGNVVLQFSRRLSNAHFIGTGEGYSYWENVRISGIRPGNGGSVQHWHWNWHADNWVP